MLLDFGNHAVREQYQFVEKIRKGVGMHPQNVQVERAMHEPFVSELWA
jgi:hypothetical protein